ncbi:DUF2442 domain-containing protein [candidate division KSB1 bacterium]|nr:DUF2442 domain-containing protein [candidate division KSB1 bacterium]
MMKFERLIRVKAAEFLHDFWVRLVFTDGTQRELDLAPYLRGPIFEPLRNNPVLFREGKVDNRMGTIVWNNGADLDPDVLYHGLKPAWMETKEELERQTVERNVIV